MNASLNATFPLPLPGTTPPLLLKASEQRALLAAVVGLHLLLGAWLISSEALREATAEPHITVSLLEAPAPARRETARPTPPKLTPPAPSPKATTTPQASLTPSHQPTPVAATASAASTPAASSEARPSTAQPTSEARAETFTQARFDADYLQNPAPPYPPLARRMHEEGKVVLRVSVTPQGLAESVEIKTSSGSERLDQAALKTVKQWKFVPARRGDAAVQSWVLVPVQFKLEQ